jgi:sarcosine oxidase delta subunit
MKEIIDCPHCEEGRIEYLDDLTWGGDVYTHFEDCPYCDGSGEIEVEVETEDEAE